MSESDLPEQSGAVAVRTEYEAIMWQAVAEVAAARALLDEADLRLQQARDAVAPAIRRFGAALDLDDEPVDRETVRVLYWDHPDIRAKDISDAFAIPGGPGAVHQYSGALETTVPCIGGCGSPMRIKNRTNWSTSRLCDDCRARRAEEARGSYEEWLPRWRAIQAAQEQEERAFIREQQAAGLTPEEILKAWEPEETSSLARAGFGATLIKELSDQAKQA